MRVLAGCHSITIARHRSCSPTAMASAGRRCWCSSRARRMTDPKRRASRPSKDSSQRHQHRLEPLRAGACPESGSIEAWTSLGITFLRTKWVRDWARCSCPCPTWTLALRNSFKFTVDLPKVKAKQFHLIDLSSRAPRAPFLVWSSSDDCKYSRACLVLKSRSAASS